MFLLYLVRSAKLGKQFRFARPHLPLLRPDRPD